MQATDIMAKRATVLLAMQMAVTITVMMGKTVANKQNQRSYRWISMNKKSLILTAIVPAIGVTMIGV